MSPHPNLTRAESGMKSPSSNDDLVLLLSPVTPSLIIIITPMISSFLSSLSPLAVWTPCFSFILCSQDLHSVSNFNWCAGCKECTLVKGAFQLEITP
ncbi:hypothetical protein N431DRAFT_111676 [Stipitochalara longipes BDJ]|nr:hypothetical protein N431DRAFT_111676 [Stipitochalara longipes BDJ]